MTERPSLLDAAYRAVSERTPFPEATFSRLTVGDRLVLVEVVDRNGDRSAGVAHRPPGTLDVDPAGEPAVDVARWATDAGAAGEVEGATAPLRRAVGVATMNALSAGLVPWRTGDPFEALSADVTTIATVGLFGPAFRKFGAVEVRVIERREVEPPETPEGVSVELFDPGAAEEAMRGADVVFVTGSTLLYGGTEAYLAAARGVPSVVLVGATASFVPEPAFEAGVTMLAGARVTDARAVREGALVGACATDLHDDALEKVYVTATASGGRGLDLG